MKFEIFLLTCAVKWCSGVRLSPLENNDKLEDITNLYVAEWQWESWPVKQGSTESRSPSQRKNVALWKESSGSAWYLFGGRPASGDPKKVYSDVWKFTVKTRAWKRVFPSQGEVKTGSNKTATAPFRVKIFESDPFHQEESFRGKVLCGGLGKGSAAKGKKAKPWSGYRRKPEEEEPEDRLASLAVYAPRTSKSNTVWQMDAQKKLWTTYVCCCDAVHNRNGSSRGSDSKSNSEERDECSVSKINKAEDKMEEEHLKMGDLKNKKKKINQEKVSLKKINVEKRAEKKLEEENRTKIKEKNETKSEKAVESKMASEFCPDFPKNGTPVTWCYGRHQALVTSDISRREVVLWVFNLTTSHWSQVEVNISSGIEWPACSDSNSVRFAGNEFEVYIVCSQKKTTEEPTDSGVSGDNFNEKLVFRISYSDRTLHGLGTIRLNSFFNSPEGEKVWRNESEAILQAIGTAGNETILVLAYLDMVDLWVLSKGPNEKESFHLVEKIWRGSALKWFDKYGAALYSMQFVSETGKSETVLLANPRKIAPSEYWPRERGRFIIRVFRNENLKNQSFENKTREQNLTYELLQSDYKPNGAENQGNHLYNLKVVVFFGISLAIFSVFGIVLFLKRCVNCPPRIPARSECQKSPLVIRYSVIPDDLLYPVA